MAERVKNTEDERQLVRLQLQDRQEGDMVAFRIEALMVSVSVSRQSTL